MYQIFEVRRGKTFITLPFEKKHKANLLFCCVKKAHAKAWLCRVPNISCVFFWVAHNKKIACRVPEKLPTANFRHTATKSFPVVHAWSGSDIFMDRHVFVRKAYLFHRNRDRFNFCRVIRPFAMNLNISYIISRWIVNITNLVKLDPCPNNFPSSTG